MPLLNFGENEVPYQYSKTPLRMRRAREGKAARPRPDAYTVTTLEVARFLEKRYHVMEVFHRVHGDDIAKFMADDMVKAFQNIKLGMPRDILNRSLLQTAMSHTEDAFRRFVFTGEAERVGIPDTPTQASIDRHSLRFKNQVSPSGRPSFYSTGQYIGNFRAWITR